MFKSCTRFENEPLDRGVKESKKFQHNKKKKQKISRTLCLKLPFSKILPVQRESKMKSRKSRNSSEIGHPEIYC